MKDISVMYLLEIAWKRLWALVLAAVVFAGAAFVYCKFIATPKYSATASVMVTNGGLVDTEINQSTTSSSIKTSDLSASLSVADTVVDILKTPELYKTLSRKTGNKFSYTALMSMASVSRRSDESLFVDVTFSSSDREESIKLVNTFVNIAPEYVKEYIPNSYSKCTENAGISSQTAPRTTFTTVLFGVLGALAVYVVFLLTELLNRTINSSEELTENFGIPLLGVVPDFEETGANENYAKAGNYGGY